MQYQLSDVAGNQTVHTELTYLKSYLARPVEYWQMMTGDSAITVKKGECLLFFKTSQGMFIMQHPDYLGPKVQDKTIRPVTHYVGGEPLDVPNICLMDEATAFKIMEHYIKEQGLHKEYEWEGIYDILEKMPDLKQQVLTWFYEYLVLQNKQYLSSPTMDGIIMDNYATIIYDGSFGSILNEIVAEGLLSKTEKGYSLTDKGKAYISG